MFNSMKRSAIWLCYSPLLIAYSLVAYSAPVATEYEVDLIDAPLTPNPTFGTPWTEFWNINNAGKVTFDSFTIDAAFDETQAFGSYDVKKKKFTILELGPPDTLGPLPFATNTSGVSVGSSDGQCVIFDRKGAYTTFNHPIDSDRECTARAIAANGVVSGFTIDDQGIWRGFAYDPVYQTFQDFLPSADQTLAQGINAQGQIVGSTRAGGGNDGFLRETDGSVRLFRVTIDGVRHDTRARGISDDGTIVGAYINQEDGAQFAGFVGRLSDDPDDHDLIPTAVFKDIPECDFLIWPQAVNNKGVIVGLCWDFAGDITKGLLLTPKK